MQKRYNDLTFSDKIKLTYIMQKIKHFLTYLNPIARFGNRRYSFLLAFFTTLVTIIIVEFFAYVIVRDPNSVGLAAIFLFIALIIYFSFRDGIIGGFTTVFLTIAYYFYIVYSRHYKGQQYTSSLETIFILALLYLALAGVIGWLKQTIDSLIDREADEKRRLQAIVEQLPVGVLITDSKGKITRGNKQADKILGLKIPIGFDTTKQTLVNSTHNGKIIPPSQSAIAQALTANKSIVGKEIVVNREDGKKVHIQVSASTIQNKNNQIIAGAIIMNDITQQKELEERKDDFVNMASHELKTPITSMKLYLDLLFKKIKVYKDTSLQKTVNSIQGQTDKLQELVNDLLDVSRLQTGKLSFTKEVFRMDNLIKELIEDLQQTTDRHKLLFTQSVPTLVYADRFRIYQVLTNLITNAIKYSSSGNIEIAVKKQKGSAIVSVTDKGIGIAKTQQKRIFDRLYQVSDPKEKTYPGLGMGLYISKQIMKRHKGTIWVTSEKGKGSTFYFSLPLQRKSL